MNPGFQVLAFSLDGKTLAIGGIDRKVSLCDVTWLVELGPGKR